VAEAKPAPGKGEVTGFSELNLEYDEAVELDCPQLMGRLKPTQPARTFLKGFAVLESERELDVVAVYSGTQGANWPLNTFHTERVAGRCVPPCGDLAMTLNTGYADWRVVATGNPVVVLDPAKSPGGSSMFGAAKWVGETQDDGTHVWNPPNKNNDPLGIKEYELAFNLCPGFVPADTGVAVNVDDEVALFLNSHAVTIAGGNGVLPGSALRVGTNRLRVRVTNTFESLAGFVLSGQLQIKGGECCGPVPTVQRRVDGVVGGEALGQ